MHFSDGRRRVCGDRRYFCAQTLPAETRHRIKQPVGALKGRNHERA